MKKKVLMMCTGVLLLTACTEAILVEGVGEVPVLREDLLREAATPYRQLNVTWLSTAARLHHLHHQ